MTTPTPGKPTVAATPPVSTPFSQSHLAFSPARPHPSPRPKKSPANSHTIYNHPSNTSFPMNFDSPSAAAALGTLPNLGFEGLSLEAFAGEGQRLAAVIDILAANKGRVSENGLENLARSVGLESLWEDQMNRNGRTLIIAGNGIALDIGFMGGIVQKVDVQFVEQPDSVTKHSAKAGAVFLRDLELAEGECVLTKMLDRFAGNLERLAAMDKLSVGVNCYAAVAGIYESLNRLWEWEVEKLKIKGKEDEEACKRLVMCTKSGKPEMHTHGHIGLSLSYWTTQHLLSEPSLKPHTWSILIECAPLAFTYPIRVSTKWISPSIHKASPSPEELMTNTTDPILDWLDPEQTFLAGDEKKLPEVMFIAKFNPAIIVPFSVASRIHATINLPPDTYPHQTFDGLLFPPTADEVLALGETRILKRCKTIPIRQDGSKTHHKHLNQLLIDKIDFGRAINSLPFSHPRELISILPWLRQYAFLSTLLQNSFGGDTNLPPSTKPRSRNKADAFEAFMSTEEDNFEKDEEEDVDLSIDVSLQTAPMPRITLNFPFKKRAATIVFDVHLGGTVAVRWENLLADQRNPGRFKPENLAHMLEVCEEIGTFVEFVRWRL